MKKFLLAFLLGTIVSCVSHAQESTNALPPDAQEAVKNGIIAAQNKDYELAIQYFQDARKQALTSPEICYNLGLAESHIPGRELRAVCWFSAFLAVETNSPKASAICDQIDVLLIKSRSNILKLMKSLQDTALNLTISAGGPEFMVGDLCKSLET